MLARGGIKKACGRGATHGVRVGGEKNGGAVGGTWNLKSAVRAAVEAAKGESAGARGARRREGAHRLFVVLATTLVISNLNFKYPIQYDAAPQSPKARVLSSPRATCLQRG